MNNLIFNSLHISNFRLVDDAGLVVKFDVQPGLYLVSGSNKLHPELGPNGLGKTTIFSDALYWCLTGKTIRDSRPGASIENWYEPKKVEVVLFLNVNGIDHAIKRTRRPNSLTLDGSVVEQPVIDSLISLSAETLRRTILVGQFGQLFLDLRAEQQSQLFTDTLDLSAWLDASDKASQKSKSIDGQLLILTKKQTRIVGELQATIKLFNETADKEETFEDDRKQKLESARLEMEEAGAALDSARNAHSCAYKRDPKEIDIGPLKNEIAAVQASIADVDRKLGELTSDRRSNQQKLEKQKQYLASYKDKLCPECGQVIKNAEFHLPRLQKEIDTTTKLLQEQRDKDKLLAESRALQSHTLDALNKQWQEKQDQEKKLIISLNNLSTLETTFKSKKNKVDELKNQSNPHTSICDQLGNRIKSFEQEEIKLQEKISSLEKENEVYKFWVKGFKEIRLNIIDQVLMELELSANRHALSLGLVDWEIKFATERETTSGQISSSFTCFLYPPDMSEPIRFESYSGGETQRLQLAVTFGLSEILLSRAGFSPNIEILDEPTAHLSSEGIEDLLVCLKDRAIETKRALFLIDHRSLDKGLFDGVYWVIRSSDGVQLEVM